MDKRKNLRTMLLLSIIFLSACTSKTERDYMQGCVANGAPKDLCECSFEKLEDMYSEEVFDNIHKGYIPPDFMDKMIESTKMCVAENQ